MHNGADSAPGASSSQWERGIRLEALANLAHELRSPVQALLGYLDILGEEMVDYLPGEHRHVVERMNVNVHDLAQTVENLLEFALADANAEALVEEDCDLADLRAELSPALEAANAGKHLSLETHVDPAIGKVRPTRRPPRQPGSQCDQVHFEGLRQDSRKTYQRWRRPRRARNHAERHRAGD
jgi:signal transduction histidine kinase